MKRLALIAALILLTASQASAANPVPGSACPSGVSSGDYTFSGGSNSGSIYNLLVCNAGTYSGVVNFQTTGNVGIGTTSPAAKLEVSGDMMLASVSGAAAPTTANYSEIAGNSNNGTLATGSAYYFPANGSLSASTTTDASAGTRTIIARAATIQNLYYIASASSTSTITVMKNGVATTVTCSTSASTTCNDTSHTFTVVAGDELGIKIAATTTAVKHSWSIGASH